MSVQKGSYYDMPIRGYDGDLAELGNYQAGLQIAAEALNVGRAIEKRGDLADDTKTGSFDYTVGVPISANSVIVGVTLRVPGLKENQQYKVPIYEKDNEVNFLQQGYMWILLDENSAAVVSPTTKAHVVYATGTFQKGQIVNNAVVDHTVETSQIRFMSKAQPGEMVKIWVNCLLV